MTNSNLNTHMADDLTTQNWFGNRAPDRRSVWLGLGLVALIGIAAFSLFRSKGDQVELADVPFQPPEQITGQPEAVKGVSDIPGGQVVFSERTVTNIDESGNNQYHHRFVAADFTGLKQAVFAEADNLQYEPITMYGPDRLVIFDESGETEKNRVLALNGQTVEEFTPWYRPGGFLKSPDGKTLAYIDDVEPTEADDSTAEKLVIRSIDSGAERSIESAKFNSGDLKFTAYYLMAWSPDNRLLYVEALVDPNEPLIGYAFAQVDTQNDSVDLMYVDTGNPDQTNQRELVGVYPNLGFAIFQTVDYGSIDQTDSKVETVIERFDLSTKSFAGWLKRDSVVVPVSPFLDPLSPDGNYLVLESQTEDIQGVIIWNAQTGELERLTDRGSFLAWSPDSRFMLFEILDEAEATGGYQLNSLEISEKRQYQIYSQDVLSEGTGLNQIGDRFNQYIGVAS